MYSKNLYDALEALTQEQIAQLNEKMKKSDLDNITMSKRFKPTRSEPVTPDKE